MVIIFTRAKKSGISWLLAEDLTDDEPEQESFCLTASTANSKRNSISRGPSVTGVQRATPEGLSDAFHERPRVDLKVQELAGLGCAFTPVGFFRRLSLLIV
jgi:hypothetical protein